MYDSQYLFVSFLFGIFFTILVLAGFMGVGWLDSVQYHMTSIESISILVLTWTRTKSVLGSSRSSYQIGLGKSGSVGTA